MTRIFFPDAEKGASDEAFGEVVDRRRRRRKTTCEEDAGIDRAFQHAEDNGDSLGYSAFSSNCYSFPGHRHAKHVRCIPCVGVLEF